MEETCEMRSVSGRTSTITTREVSVTPQSQGMRKYKKTKMQGLPMTHTIGGGRRDAVTILPRLGISH